MSGFTAIEVIYVMAADLAPAGRALVHQHFRTTSRYEWMSWDMGYREPAVAGLLQSDPQRSAWP